MNGLYLRALFRHIVAALAVAVLTGNIVSCSRLEQPPETAPLSDGDEVTSIQFSGPDRTVEAEDAADPPAGDWPNWRGPRHDGISRETGWTSKWPVKGPGVLWRSNVGIGYSSFSIADGRAFTMGHKDGEETVFCFNAETGEEIWTHRYPAKIVANLHKGGPGASPTVDGDRVYTISRDGLVHCFEVKTGKVEWTLQVAEEMGVKLPEWGFTSSPFLLEDHLIFDAGRVVALDKHNGKIIWKTAKFKPGYGTPIAFQYDGNTVLAVLNNEYLLVVRASDGAEVARYEWETDYGTNSTTPIPSAGTLFISSGYNHGCSLLTLKDDKLTPVYENRSMRNHMNNCVLSNGFLYGFDGNSHSRRNVLLVCMNHRSGEVQWTKRELGCGALMMSDGKLILLSDQGDLITAEATPDEYKEISRAKVLDATCWTMPVLAHGRIYCRNDIGDVICVDVRQ